MCFIHVLNMQYSCAKKKEKNSQNVTTFKLIMASVKEKTKTPTN